MASPGFSPVPGPYSTLNRETSLMVTGIWLNQRAMSREQRAMKEKS